MSTLTANMNLVVPTVSVEPGPDWATEINADLGILDQHDHSSGMGVQITPSGMNINTDFTLNGYNLVSTKTVNFENQSASLSGAAPNLGCIYVAGGELYYNDEAGNVVKITLSGNVNAGAGSITGLPSGTASASFGAGTFVWQSATSTPANTDTGSIILRNITASSKGLTISPPNALAADYSLVMPPTNSAGSTVFLTYDTSNNIGATALFPLTGTSIASATVTGSNIAASTITNTNVADATLTVSKMATMTVSTNPGANGFAISASSGSFSTSSTSAVNVTNLSITVTSSGRPIMINVFPVRAGGSPSTSGIQTSGSNACNITLQRGGVNIIRYIVGGVAAAWPSSITFIDDGFSVGTNVYNLTANTSNAATSISIGNCVISGYEI